MGQGICVQQAQRIPFQRQTIKDNPLSFSGKLVSYIRLYTVLSLNYCGAVSQDTQLGLHECCFLLIQEFEWSYSLLKHDTSL